MRDRGWPVRERRLKGSDADPSQNPDRHSEARVLGGLHGHRDRLAGEPDASPAGHWTSDGGEEGLRGNSGDVAGVPEPF